jgi:hypothetical protein
MITQIKKLRYHTCLTSTSIQNCVLCDFLNVQMFSGLSPRVRISHASPDLVNIQDLQDLQDLQIIKSFLQFIVLDLFTISNPENK